MGKSCVKVAVEDTNVGIGKIDDTQVGFDPEDIYSVSSECQFPPVVEIDESIQGSSSQQSQPKRKRKSAGKSTDDIISEAYSAFQHVAQTPVTPEDDFYIYGRFVGNELRQFKDNPHLLASVKFQINSVIFKAQMQQFGSEAIVSEIPGENENTS